MTTPEAPQEEPTKEASNGPLIENLKAPVNVTELSALGSPTDELERDFLWIENVQEFIRVRDYEFIREAFITALQLLRSAGMTEGRRPAIAPGRARSRPSPLSYRQRSGPPAVHRPDALFADGMQGDGGVR